MPPRLLRVRPSAHDEAGTIERLSLARTEAAQTVLRARFLWRSHSGQRVSAIAEGLNLSEATVRKWIRRFSACRIHH